jgi:solute carrier family 25, member 34/35
LNNLDLNFRLGIYNTAYENGWTRNKDGTVCILRSAFFGGVGGTIGQGLASPFFMLRNQLQSASVDKIAVGYQHKHDGFVKAFKKIYNAHGFAGLYRGVLVTVPRGMMGSGTQIATFGWTKDFLQRKFTHMDQTTISFVSGATAGTAMAVAMNPADVISTRLYNQGVTSTGKGIYYSGVIDCFVKILKVEGFAGFYKGFWPHYIRIGPHSALVLLFFDELKTFKERLFKR